MKTNQEKLAQIRAERRAREEREKQMLADPRWVAAKQAILEDAEIRSYIEWCFHLDVPRDPENPLNRLEWFASDDPEVPARHKHLGALAEGSQK